MYIYVNKRYTCYTKEIMKTKRKFIIRKVEEELFGKIFVRKIFIPIEKEGARKTFIKKLNKKQRPISFAKGK